MMEQPFSTSRVAVEYFDPHDVYKLLAPGLVPRLPLRNLRWQSHAGPLRSIDSLWIELVNANGAIAAQPNPGQFRRSASTSTHDDGFQTQQIGRHSASTDNPDAAPAPSSSSTTTASAVPTAGKERRHQIPGLRKTPYLKILFVRCDDNDSYKSTTRAEIREWIKQNTPPSQSARKSTQENHDVFEWLVVHVVVPNTAAANQPRFNGKTGSNADGSAIDKASSTSSRWRTGSSTLLEKMRADFNSSGKGAFDRVAQIRIGINDLPYDDLPRVVPAPPTGYSENERDAENAWNELLVKFKTLILASFDSRVTQYEDDIREKDGQRTLPGWNFCTFFILKEGLARGFESVGLVEDALVGYDELSVGLDSVVQEQIISGEPERHGGALLSFTQDLKEQAEKALAAARGEGGNVEDEEAVDLQSKPAATTDTVDEIPIGATKKRYRDMIVANNVSVLDFRCYIFSRQLSLLLRLGNAWTSQDELLAKLKEHQDTILEGGALPSTSAKEGDQGEQGPNLSPLAEICRRALVFIPSISHVMRKDIISAITGDKKDGAEPLDPLLLEIIDNIVASFAFSIAQQILVQTSAGSLPIPPSTLPPPEIQEPKAAIPEPKTMMHPARSTSLRVSNTTRNPVSPGIFPGPGLGRRASVSEGETTSTSLHAPKAGLEDLAARRAELYAMSLSMLKECGGKRGWDDGWASVPNVGEAELLEMEDVSLDDDAPTSTASPKPTTAAETSLSGLDARLLRAALDNKDDFYRLYEVLTDNTIRHYTLASYGHAVQANMTDLAVLKYQLGEYATAASYFYRTTPAFGDHGWNLLELSMLIMYSDCLQRLQRKDEFVRIVLKLLTKAAAAEREYLSQTKSLKLGAKMKAERPSVVAVRGILAKLTDVTRSLPNEVPVPLGQVFSDLRVEGVPLYDDDRDGFTLTVSFHSLLVDDLTVQQGQLRLTGSSPGLPKEVLLDLAGHQKVNPGRNTIRLHGKTTVTGQYYVDRLSVESDNLHFHYEHDIDQGSNGASAVFAPASVTLHRQSGGMECQLSAAKHVQLDRNNNLDLKLSTGWNTIKSCEIRVRPGTGGLRLLTRDVEVVSPDMDLAQPPEAGSFKLGPMDRGTDVILRFPYSTEQDVSTISVYLEVTYVTEHDTYQFSSSCSIPISLALGVNVQDVFKHDAIFSRFSVSTASPSPLVLLKSELQNSDIFEAHFGFAPTAPVMVFPKQPASLLYKITRKPGVNVQAGTKKTLYLKLFYRVILDEIVAEVTKSLAAAAADAGLSRYSSLLVSYIERQCPAKLSAFDLERAGLLRQVSTDLVLSTQLEQAFAGLGKVADSNEDVSSALARLVRDWQKSNRKLALSLSETPDNAQSILIPVEVPPVPILYTADVQLPKLLPPPSPVKEGGAPVVGINQLISANLQLKWTRAWDTAVPPSSASQVYSYEVTAPPDTWLLGGRKRGRMVASAPDDDNNKPGSSASPQVLNIPLMMVPLREGHLPYPAVDIREAKAEDEGAPPTQGHVETDFRNLGETVRVVADREKVTLSLDSSGPGGGPLVLEGETRVLEGRVVV